MYGQASSAPCVTILYAPATPAVDVMMARVASAAGLSVGPDGDVRSFGSGEDIAGWLFDHAAALQVEAAVVFSSNDDELAHGSVAYSLVRSLHERMAKMCLAKRLLQPPPRC